MGATPFIISHDTDYVVAVDEGKKEIKTICSLVFEATPCKQREQPRCEAISVEYCNHIP